MKPLPSTMPVRNQLASQSLQSGEPEAPDHSMTYCAPSLRPYQLAGVDFALNEKKVLIGDEMGIGKTPQALAVFREAGAFPFVVLTPASLKLNWEREARIWLSDKVCHVIQGKKTYELPQADMIVLNYDILSAWHSILMAKHFRGIVMDESHYLKDYKSKRTKLVIDLAQGKEYRLALTGTPILNRPVELVPQIEAIGRMKELGGKWNFLNRYCSPRRTPWGTDFSGAANLDELNHRLRATFYIRRTKQEVLPELPAKQRNILPVILTNQGAYKKANRETIQYILNEVKVELSLTEAGKQSTQDMYKAAIAKAASSTNVLARIEALKQASAWGKVDDILSWTEAVLESGEKLILFAIHKEIIGALRQKLGKDYGVVCITGETSSLERDKAVAAFQADPAVRVILLNIKAGGVGLTLTSASYVAFAELDWSYAVHLQAEDRCHRYGQKNAVNVWYFLGKDTIDEDIYHLLEQKRAVTELATNGLTDEVQTCVKAALIKRLISKEHIR